MASAWGKSWGKSWVNSWGNVGGGGGGSARGGKKRKGPRYLPQIEMPQPQEPELLPGFSRTMAMAVLGSAIR